MKDKYDVIFAGCGFANGILAYRIHQVRPDLSLLIVDKSERLGEGFHEFLQENNKADFLLGKKIAEVKPDGVVLGDGSRYAADCVFDGRGFREKFNFAGGYQKFVGIDVTLSRPHNLSDPIIMDATVPQKDGFCFMYVIPWSYTSMLIEDTRYSDTPEMDIEESQEGMLTYAESKGWKVKSVVRVETGPLIIPLESDPDLKADLDADLPVMGIRAGLFHPITSYVVPPSVRLADEIAQLPRLESHAVARHLKKSIHRILPPEKTFHLLSRMLFLVARPEERYKVLQYFYTKNDKFISRFYAGDLRFYDYLNLGICIPPVSFTRLARLFSKPG